MLDQMSHLFHLRVVVESGSMRRAAENLNVTQPALSRSIAQLEKQFGRLLLVRHARGVEPTEYGRRVVRSIMRLERAPDIRALRIPDFGADLASATRFF